MFFSWTTQNTKAYQKALVIWSDWVRQQRHISIPYQKPLAKQWNREKTWSGMQNGSKSISNLIYSAPAADQIEFDTSKSGIWYRPQIDPKLIHQKSKNDIWCIKSDPSKFDPIWSKFDPSTSIYDIKWGSNVKYQIVSNVNPLFSTPGAEISANHLGISKNQWKIDIRDSYLIRTCQRWSNSLGNLIISTWFWLNIFLPNNAKH